MSSTDGTGINFANPTNRIEALIALSETDRKLARNTIHYIALHDKNNEVRSKAIEILFQSDNPPCNEDFIFSDSEAIRDAFAKVISKKSHGTSLTRMLNARHWQERVFACTTLWYIYEEKLPEEVLDALLARFKHEHHIQVTKKLAICLSRSGHEPSVRECLSEFLKDSFRGNHQNVFNLVWRGIAENNHSKNAQELLNYLANKVAEHAMQGNDEYRKKTEKSHVVFNVMMILAERFDLTRNRQLITQLMAEDACPNALKHIREEAEKHLEAPEAIIFLVEHIGVTFRPPSESDKTRKKAINTLVPFMKEASNRQLVINFIANAKHDGIIDSLELLGPYKNESGVINELILSYISVSQHEDIALKAIEIMQDELHLVHVRTLVEEVFNKANGRLKFITMKHLAKIKQTEEIFKLCQNQIKDGKGKLLITCLKSLWYFENENKKQWVFDLAIDAFFGECVKPNPDYGLEFLTGLRKFKGENKYLLDATMSIIVKRFDESDEAKQAFFNALHHESKAKQHSALRAASLLIENQKVFEAVLKRIDVKDWHTQVFVVLALKDKVANPKVLTSLCECYKQKYCDSSVQSEIRPLLLSVLVPSDSDPLPDDWAPNEELMLTVLSFEKIYSWKEQWENSLFSQRHLDNEHYRKTMQPFFYHFFSVASLDNKRKAMDLLETE